MDPVLLARIQFAMTVGFHYIFPPITIGMAWIIFWFMHRYLKTGNEIEAQLARFWTRVFAVTFAVGVATGITMEFQFGTNWAEYSRFVGDIFGAPLAAEGVLAFFLESTFMGVLLFGWGRFSKRVLWLASLLVAAGATLSAFWIIVANSWMQTPAGFHIVNGRAELTDFWAAVFNPSTIPRYLHTIDAAVITGAFFVMSLSAILLLRKQHVELARRSLKVSLVFGLVASLLQLPIGDMHAVQVAETQPEKLAAFEGLFETQKEAPLLLFGIPNPEERRVDAQIAIPGGLSLLVGRDLDTEVKGLNDFPEDEWPPILPVFASFHTMVGLGMAFIGVTLLGVLLLWRRKLYDNRLFLMIAAACLPLPTIANQLGWMAAEIGRQPWIVYRVEGMRTAQAVSKVVSAGEILTSLILFGVMYLLLFVLWVHLVRRQLTKGADDHHGTPAKPAEEVTP